MRGARVRLELLQFACLIVSQLGSISTLCLIPTVHSFSSLRVQRNTHGVLANPDLSQAMAPSKKKRTHAVFCISSAHRLASTSKPRFVGEKICLNQVIRSLPASKAVIKKKAATEYADGLYPAFSASGQDVWLPDYRYNCHGVVVSAVGARCGKAFKASGKWNVVANTHPLALDEERIDWDYAWRLLNNENWWIKSGSGQPFVKVRESLKRSIYLPPLSIQKQFAANLRGVESQISIAQRSLAALDSLVKSRFVEIFGDLKLNKYNWPIEPFESFAVIDTHMANNLDAYANKPHIGIDSIESNSGRLSGYRTVAEDGIISGKYPFTAQHIIYSKIRPALNKVALPDFDGVCSADAYPILPAKERCNRIYLAQVMRSSYFLDYVLPLSGRAQMPKVNKKALQGFSMPLPPLELQQEFAAFVAQVDKSRFVRDHEMNFR